MAFVKRSTFEVNETNIAKLLLCDKALMSRSPIMLPNCYISKAQDNEADVFAIRKTNFCDEFEIKCSRADFLADRKKIIQFREPAEAVGIFGNSEYSAWSAAGRVKGDEPWTMNKLEAYSKGLGTPNFFWYVLSDSIKVDESEIPSWAGVYLVSQSGWLTKKRNAKKLHKNKISDKLYTKVLEKGLYRYLKTLRGW